MDWKNKTILITGGTGSFGKKFVEIALENYRPKKLIVFSRDELKQHEMRSQWDDSQPDSPMRYFVGDIRDKERLYRAMQGVDVVIHAAALKQVPACEYNPFEAVQTNIIGTKNVIDAAIDAGVERILALSTDKAVNPVNLYGATKLVAEKILVQGNSYVGSRRTRFSCVRYGNVVGSRGSVVQVFKKQAETGCVTVTDERMTRFWITLEQGVNFIIHCLSLMFGGEVFVPKLPSMRVMDLAKAVAPNCQIRVVGIRPGEKIHESLLSDNEVHHTVEHEGMYVVKPLFPWWGKENWNDGRRLPDGFQYRSDENEHWLTGDDLRRMAGLAVTHAVSV
jgi:UDP-N-acetylglucosamine 4,6-dehydratase/5-epimerase